MEDRPGSTVAVRWPNSGRRSRSLPAVESKLLPRGAGRQSLTGTTNLPSTLSGFVLPRTTKEAPLYLPVYRTCSSSGHAHLVEER